MKLLHVTNVKLYIVQNAEMKS